MYWVIALSELMCGSPCCPKGSVHVRSIACTHLHLCTGLGDWAAVGYSWIALTAWGLAAQDPGILVWSLVRRHSSGGFSGCTHCVCLGPTVWYCDAQCLGMMVFPCWLWLASGALNRSEVVSEVSLGIGGSALLAFIAALYKMAWVLH